MGVVRRAATAADDRVDCTVTRIFRPALAPTPVPAALESVHAGFPSVAQDYFAGDFSFDEHVIAHPDTTFIITVAGDSMEGAGIWDGDLLVVDRSLEPQAGDVVVAILDDELTVKRLIMRGSTPVLHAENPRYPDFMSSDAAELVVWGVVVGNFHPQSRRRRFGEPMAGVTRPGMRSRRENRTGRQAAQNPVASSPTHQRGATVYHFPDQRGQRAASRG
ncbi:S24 family peptidase [Bifidobacterium sp. ESL0763]|uniref:LexA family protein n=1 Tax=Bifidobacterium sp. ESL0763 TaxID=2983227 RepID=UPI0023F61D1B|nr:S24 family peptidase [Bifidobacterium sp. ESL0763]MDF7663977.1 S24 family peptidase [Bifidobacterium sp. ESL0763]